MLSLTDFILNNIFFIIYVFILLYFYVLILFNIKYLVVSYICIIFANELNRLYCLTY